MNRTQSAIKKRKRKGKNNTSNSQCPCERQAVKEKTDPYRMRPKLPEAKTKSQNTSKEKKSNRKKVQQLSLFNCCCEQKEKQRPLPIFGGPVKNGRGHIKTSQCFIKKNNGTSVALSAVQTQTKLFCVEKILLHSL